MALFGTTATAVTSSTCTSPRRLRAAAPHGSGGASSLLRLSARAAALPSGAALGHWMQRAATALREAA